jgi:fluoroquinolone transport system permease protein
MSRASQVRALARNDVRLIGRDRFVIGLGLYIIAMSLVLRFVLPGITASLLAERGFDLTAFYSLLNSYVSVFLGGLLGGMVFGFTLLEAREDGTIRAVLVSPLPLDRYVGYRVLSAYVFCAVIIPLQAVLVGAALPPAGALVAISLVGALMGPAWAFINATYADNKVSAFALMKALGGSGLILIGAFFLDEPLQFVAGVFPPYWVVKAYWVAIDGGPWWAYLGVGLVLLLATLVFLSRRLIRVLHR